MQRKKILQAALTAASLLVLTACADAGAVPAPSSTASAALAVDLGASSRVRRIAGLAGEGEGYGMAPAVSPASMSSGQYGSPGAPGTADHSGHGAMPGMAQAPQAPAPDMGSRSAAPADHSAMPGMSPEPGKSPQTAQAGHVTGTGTVNAVDAAGRKVTLAHNAIPSIGWPAMTMDFAVAPSVDLGSIKPGTRVDFMMMQGSGGMYVIQSITPAQGGR